MIHFVCTRKGEMNNFTQIRVGRREKYFGHKTHENLSKLTDLLFKERRDNYFLASILGGSTEYIEEDELDTYLDELIQEKLQDKTIDWETINSYYQERLEYIDSQSSDDDRRHPHRRQDILQVMALLNKYQDQMREHTTDNFCLY